MPPTIEQLRRSIEPLSQRRGEIEQLLADPAINSDPQRLSALTREYRQATALLARFRELQRLDSELRETEQLARTATDPELRELAENEYATLSRELARLAAELESALRPRPEEWSRNCIVEIRAAAGGTESTLFAADLFRMYSRYAERHSLKVEVLSSHPSELQGYREIIFSVEGNEPYRYFRFESGVHRVQRVPETEASGRIHTSTATVAVLPQAQETELIIRPEDLKLDFFRAGGKGGQNVNKVSSAVRITHIPSGIVVSCQDERSQARNRQKAMKVLAARLLDIKARSQQSQTAEKRRRQIGTGERSEKIRTYNFPQNRVTDHRIGLSLHNLASLIQGDLDPLFKALEEAEDRLQ